MGTDDAKLTDEQFFDLVEQAFEEQDRSKVARLGKTATQYKNLKWQAIVRHTDNILIAIRNKNKRLEDDSRAKILEIVSEIRGKK